MASRRYNKLVYRITSIERNLLPPIKILGNYTKKESDLIRSYILLAHAEVESYLEDIAKEKAKSALDKWNGSRKKSNCLLSLMTFMGGEINWSSANNNTKYELATRLNRTVVHYIATLDKNHGIKSNNVLNILLPLGIEINEFDQAWLATMDSFGSFRGELAHTTHSTQAQIDLVTERNRINNQILPELDVIDTLFK